MGSQAARVFGRLGQQPFSGGSITLPLFLGFVCDRARSSALQLNVEAYFRDGAAAQRIGEPSPAFGPIVKYRCGPTDGDDEIRAYGNDDP